jgi:hypothetical protein
MKIFKSVFFLAVTAFAFLSCQKELNFDNNGVSTGTFKKDAGGDCLSPIVTGVFKVDSTLSSNYYVDVQVNVTYPGTFDIRTDTVNGYYFAKAGSVVLGANTIRLYAGGKPIAAGTNTFTVKYGTGAGGSTCTFDITVVGPAPSAAVYTLAGAPGACTGATVGGTYTVGTALTPANTITVTVNVTSPGTYAIGGATTNGFLFTGSGLFTAPGPISVTLTGSGTPITAGTATVAITTLTLNTCTYDITVLPAGGGGAAVFTLNGAPGNCTAPVVNGTYTINSAVTVANTVILKVDVTTAGTYNITTNTVDGITFSGSGNLLIGTAQPITLIASGTPVGTAGPRTFKPTITNSCDFVVNYVAVTVPPNTDYFPLTNNSWWSYTYSESSAPGDTLYNVIYGTKAYNGNTYSEMQDNFATIPYDTAHYRKTGSDYNEWMPSDYYSYFIQLDNPTFTDINFLKENATAGTTWTTATASGTLDPGTGTSVPATLKYTFTIVSPSTSITVNSVTYTNVIHVSVDVKFTVPSLSIVDGVTETDDYYYAKGIGLVKIVYTPSPLVSGVSAESYGIKNYKVF